MKKGTVRGAAWEFHNIPFKAGQHQGLAAAKHLDLVSAHVNVLQSHTNERSREAILKSCIRRGFAIVG
jgi:hypothetical protein